MQALFAIEGPKSLEWREVAEPQVIEDSDALVQPLAVAACDLDRVIGFNRSPFPGEFMLGHEFTGRVTEAGSGVTGFAVGDVVLASFQPSCGYCSTCSAHHSSVCEQVPNGSMYGIGEAGGNFGGAYADLIRVPWADFNLRKLREGIDPIEVASGSDNLADALRCIDGPLQRKPGGSLLIAGDGSIPLYAVTCAQHLGAGHITFASRDSFAVETAKTLGAETCQVDEWPTRFSHHDITVDGTNDVAGLSAVLKSTAPYGECTIASIYFGKPIPVPMFHLNMKGISLHTGRVNSASQLDRVMELLDGGLDPTRINPLVVPFSELIDAFHSAPVGRKIIGVPD